VIAGVQGPSIGMGVTLLALCDVVVASDAACFETPYLKLRQGPEACATYTFPRLTKKLVSISIQSMIKYVIRVPDVFVV